MVLRVTVKEHAELQKRVWRVLNARNHGSWREGSLLDITVVVLRVLVEDYPAEVVHLDRSMSARHRGVHASSASTYRELSAWPDLGHVKGVESQLGRIGIVGLHDLHLGRPFHLLSSLHFLPQFLLGVIGIFSGDTDRFGLRELLLAMLGDEVVLDVDEFALVVDPIK